MNDLVRRYARAIWLPTAVLLAVLALFTRYARDLPPAGKAAALAVVMGSYGWVGWVEFRHMQAMDEMRRRLEMEAMVLAFIAGTGSSLLLYFIHAVKLAQVPLVAMPMVLAGCYLLAHLWARLRYRYWSL